MQVMLVSFTAAKGFTICLSECLAIVMCACARIVAYWHIVFIIHLQSLLLAL